MATALSSISGLFGKAFFFGTALPVAVFLILVDAFVGPLVQGSTSQLPVFTSSGDLNLGLLALPFLFLVFSALISNLNVQLRWLYMGGPFATRTCQPTAPSADHLGSA